MHIQSMCQQNKVFTTYMSFEQKEIFIYYVCVYIYICAPNWNFYLGSITVKWRGLQESDTLKGSGTFLGKRPWNIFLLWVAYLGSVWTATVFLLSAQKIRAK